MGRPPAKGKRMTKLLTARILPAEWDVLKRAAELERDDGSLSRWLVELGLRRATDLGVRGAKKLQEPPSDSD